MPSAKFHLPEINHKLAPTEWYSPHSEREKTHGIGRRAFKPARQATPVAPKSSCSMLFLLYVAFILSARLSLYLIQNDNGSAITPAAVHFVGHYFNDIWR